MDTAKDVVEARERAAADARDRQAATGSVAHASPARDPVGLDHRARQAATRVAVGSTTKALRRKLAWAVGSVYGVKYANFNSWPAEYARRASERLLAIHGEP